ncbi:MAG: transcriptional regulator [Methylomonas sp.]|nr:MAG: transcriptional regulator [Methylomonas sp.]PPD27271.1 MAG: transcriptional regulator [Methylomonas sp.]PPD38261.1 MAG: transcriptional regulator [Methylomonas sp.]PPD39243.1 MAG: transcriptional regulator [Methylomonas sp.]PPD53685.1 MAG: transcriptional regulator [Methylomonas sp.]
MSETESLLQFPCQFAIKAMGHHRADFDAIVIEIVRRHCADIREGAVSCRPSRTGAYLSVTVMIEATSRQQLDAIYQGLTDHPDVLMAL